MNPKLLLAIVGLLLSVCASARKFDNPCGVISRFTPNNDSTVIGGNPSVVFTSQSVNATAVTWHVNESYWGAGNTQYINFGQPGIYRIMLVAKNGTCSDTSVCYYINPGVQSPNRDNTKAFYGFTNKNEYVKGLVPCYDGGYLITGTTSLYEQQFQLPYHFESGVLIKVSESGCVQWTKVLKGRQVANINAVFALPDTTYGIIGSDERPFVRVLDAAGNVKWNRNFFRNDYPIQLVSIAQCADKGYIVLSNSVEGLLVVKLDSNGNLVWSRTHYKSNTQYFSYLFPSQVVKGNDVYITATAAESAYLTPAVYNTVIIKLDAVSGITRWTKTYVVNGEDTYTKHITHRGAGLLLNTSRSNFNNNIIYLDTAGNVLQSRALLAPGINATTITSNVQVGTNGDLYIFNQGSSPLNLQPYITYKANFIKLDQAFNLKWAFHYGGAGYGRFYYHAVSTKGIFAAVGEEYSATSLANTSGIKMMLKKFDTTARTNENYLCNFSVTPITLANSTVTVQDFTRARDSAYPLEVRDTGTALFTSYAQVRYRCPTEFIDSCSFIGVTGPAGICNLGNTYTYKVHRNKACNQPVQWQVQPAATIVSQTDTAISIRFTAFGNYNVSALLPFSCTPVKDSVLVMVASRSPVLSLGADTSLCPGNTLMANAGPGFFSYLWQDGSTARTFTITAPGIYWVKTTDSCGNIFSDTLQVSLTAAVLINAGPDRMKCNVDTLHLLAPAGYLQYQWMPNYQISATNTAAVTINPLVDTTYYLRAEKSPGCFAFDTIHIQVHRSAAIQLGNDTSICTGSNIVLNAGSGFTTYQWSNGGSTPQITLGTAGTYSLVATDNFGCHSYDTFKLVTVYPLPAVRLPKDSLLCTGSKLTLNAGAGFATYAWNTGSTTQSIDVVAVGNYKVAVIDAQGCAGTDSSRITRMLPLPVGFLPADVQICSYDKATLQPSTAFNQYLWSNGATTSTITVAAPGSYWLRATDRNNCTGYDTLLVATKECIRGAYFPTAFTPNGDGRNDRFIPLLYGVVKNYQLTIYNRYGQPLFTSTDPHKGWDGNTNNGVLETGTFVWTCSFQFENEERQTRNGTVLLIR